MSHRNYLRKQKKYAAAGIICMLAFILLTVSLLTLDIGDFMIVDTNGSDTGITGTIGLSHVNKTIDSLIGGYHGTMYKLSSVLELASYASVVLLMLAALIQLITAGRFSRTFFALGAMYAVVAVCYFAFEHFVVNFRPIDVGEGAEASFPSSHSMFSVALLGAAGIECRLLWKRAGRILKPVCFAVAAATCVCRFLSGVHWLTDILGGVLLGLALASLFALGANALKRSERRAHPARARGR